MKKGKIKSEVLKHKANGLNAVELNLSSRRSNLSRALSLEHADELAGFC
jgi:hypothetical protein